MTEGEDRNASRDERIERLERALERAETRLADQSAKLKALGSGREESMRLLGDARAELSRVKAERDQLQKRLAAVEGMQVETIVLPEDEDDGAGVHAVLPSIDELMSSLDSVMKDGVAPQRSRFSGPVAEAPEAEWREMIAPEMIAPEDLGGQRSDPAPAAPTSRLLVYMDATYPIKYPLYKQVMTMGRAESADIQVDGEYVSRIHARIVCDAGGTVIEDAGSRNGFKVNTEPTRRRALKHGDIIDIGRLRFTFVEVAGRL